MKTMIRAITAILLIGVFAAISGCDFVGILGATPETIQAVPQLAVCG